MVENNTAVVRWTSTGTHDGEFMGLNAIGKNFKITVMNFYSFNKEGKIIEDIAAGGMIGILRVLGLSK